MRKSVWFDAWLDAGSGIFQVFLFGPLKLQCSTCCGKKNTHNSFTLHLRHCTLTGAAYVWCSSTCARKRHGLIDQWRAITRAPISLIIWSNQARGGWPEDAACGFPKWCARGGKTHRDAVSAPLSISPSLVLFSLNTASKLQKSAQTPRRMDALPFST